MRYFVCLCAFQPNRVSYDAFLRTAAYALLLAIFSVAATSCTREEKAGEVEVWRGDSMVATFRSIQAGVNVALPGDIIRLRGGTYHENVEIVNKQATESAIVIEAAMGETVVIDGAIPELQIPASGRWRALPGDLGWETTVPWNGKAERALLTWASYLDERLIASHHDEATFKMSPRGDALYRTGSRVWLRLANGANPNSLGINIGQSEGILNFRDSSGWIVRRLTLKHAGYAGVYLGDGVHHITLQNLTIQTAFRGISTEDYKRDKSPYQIAIRGCRILNFWNFDWEWKQGYIDCLSASSEEAAPMRGAGINLMADESEIVSCEISGQWDGICVQGRQLRIHGNLIHHTNDDMVELESNNSQNVWFYDNLGFELFSGISIGSNQPGPVFVFRNRVQSNLSVFMEKGVHRFGYPLKFGTDWGPGISNLYIYQNTFDSQGRSIFVQPTHGHPERWKNLEFVNNIFNRTASGALGLEGMGNSKSGIVWEGNLFSRQDELDRLTSFDPAFARAGIVGDPLFIGAGHIPPDLQIQEQSPARGNGSLRPRQLNWPDSVQVIGDRPDIGFQETHAIEQALPGPGEPMYWPWGK